MHSVKIIASILALLVALAGIYLGFIALRQNAQLASGEQYSRSVAEMIVTNWSPDYFIANSSRQLLANLDARGIQLKLNGARRVGEFLSMGEARGKLINPSWLPWRGFTGCQVLHHGGVCSAPCLPQEFPQYAHISVSAAGTLALFNSKL